MFICCEQKKAGWLYAKPARPFPNQRPSHLYSIHYTIPSYSQP